MGGLNGTPINGSHSELSPGLYDRMHEGMPASPAPAKVWPEAARDELDVERPRLEAEIAAAKARAAAARDRTVRRDLEMRNALRDELIASQESLAEIERQHEADVAKIREVARAEAQRILAEVRDQIAASAREGVDSEPGPVSDAG